MTTSFKKIAHRGFSSRYPENTMPSIIAAIEAGADMVDVDVHLTKDNIPVVIHDPSIDRTTNGNGMVRGMTLKDLRRFNFSYMNPEFRWVDIPTLEEVLEAVKGRAELLIELKTCPEGYDNLETIITDLLARMNMTDSCVVASCNHYSVKMLKESAPSIRRGFVYSAVWMAFEKEVMEIDPWSIHPNVNSINRQQVQWARQRGIRVYPWVARQRETLDRLSESGLIDGIVVDDMDIFNFNMMNTVGVVL